MHKRLEACTSKSKHAKVSEASSKACTWKALMRLWRVRQLGARHTNAIVKSISKRKEGLCRKSDRSDGEYGAKDGGVRLYTPCFIK